MMIIVKGKDSSNVPPKKKTSLIDRTPTGDYTVSRW